MKSKFFVLIPLSLFVLMSCQSRPTPPKVEEGLAVAKIGNITITDKDLEARIKAIESAFPRKYTAFNQKKELLTQMMNVELLYQEALNRGLDKRHEFKSRLADLYVREMAREAREKLTDKDLLAHYEKNRNQYDQVSARHILLSFEKSKGQSKAQILKKMKEIEKEVRADPEGFPNIARRLSQDSTARQGGELGYFSRGMMVPPFSRAAFGLNKIGEISPIVESQYGYHIIQLTGDKRGYDHFKELIRNQLTQQTQRARLESELARLRKGKDIIIYEDNLRKVTPLPDIVNKEVKPEDLEKTKK